MNKTTLLRYLNSVKNNINISDQMKLHRLTNELPIYLHQVMIGLMLSDGYLQKSSGTSYVRLAVSFGKIHDGYFNYIYNLFINYININPTCIKVYNKKTYSFNEVLKFKTISLPQLIYYYELFYKEGKKIIPTNIKNLMSPIVLAHLIMGNGNLKLPDKIIRIYTNSFIKSDVDMLAVAISALGIKTRVVHGRNDQYIIVINKTELSNLKSLVVDHMHSSMLYKIDVTNNIVNNNINHPIDIFRSSAKLYKI